MKLTLISNFLTHHQIPVCDTLYRELGGDFHFIATARMGKERLKMGWQLSQTYPYTIFGYGEEKTKTEEVLLHSDVIILGDCSEEWYEKVLQSDAKHVFLYSERIFKKGSYQRFGPGAGQYKAKIRRLTREKDTYILCASAYLPTDLALMGLARNRYFRWGYFPPFLECFDTKALLEQKKPSAILWAGRFLHWKHPEDAVHLAERLKGAGYAFSMNIIGDGDMRENLQALIEKKSLQKQVKILGFLSPEEVRNHMRKADIYLFTSDRFEGWGAVLNESMNAGCAVVANKEIGSAPYLIRHKENGMIYDRKVKSDLFKKVRFLLDRPEQKAEIQFNAYDTIATLWNAEMAAKRLIAFADSLQSGQEIIFEDGPCSKAKIL